LFWPLVVLLLARRPRALIAVSLTTALGAMLARLIGSLVGLSWLTTYVLTPFRLDGLALGAFLTVMARPAPGRGAARAGPALGGGGSCRETLGLIVRKRIELKMGSAAFGPL
jgi:peptidoglycan/LPS O-acetylase OafA/YrhL